MTTLEEGKRAEATLNAAVKLIVGAILDTLQSDPHQWSRRPCPTCRAISTLAQRSFGCILYAEQMVGK